MKRTHQLAVSLLALSAAILSGCVGATRLPTREKGPGGEVLPVKQLDLSFLDTPGTQRQEVLNRLSALDTSYSNPRLFWGRWSESKWGYWWVIAGGYSAAGDAKRVWHVHNLLVTFDENGAVLNKVVTDNDQSLWRELHALLAASPELDFSEPMQLDVSGPRNLAKIILAKDSLELVRNKGKSQALRISPQKVVRLSHNRFAAIPIPPNFTCHTLHFDEKTDWGKHVSVCTSAANVAAIFQYFQQAGSPTMRWD